MKVIIAGGGVGGLVTALMLHARGIDCEIFDQTDAIRELGVGINTLPHAIKELADLGLLELTTTRSDLNTRRRIALCTLECGGGSGIDLLPENGEIARAVTGLDASDQGAL